MKKSLPVLFVALCIMGVTSTAMASNIDILSLDSWTTVNVTYKGTTETVYAGEFNLKIDGQTSYGYCVDFETTTWVPSSGYTNITLATLDTITNGAQLAWVMDTYGDETSAAKAASNAAVQLVIWELLYGKDFTYNGTPGTVFTLYNQYLSAAMNQSYTGNGYSIAMLNPDAQNLLVKASPAPVPEPATLLLLGSGLIGLAGFRKKKQQ